MIEERITIAKVAVYDEVAKTTSYTGVKKVNDAEAYLRIFTTDEDRLMLERFWSEACNVATDLMKPFLVESNSRSDSGYGEVSTTDDYIVSLSLPSSFSVAVMPSLRNSLLNFFVSAIVGKWYKFTNKDESEVYLQEAQKMYDDVRRKLYYRSKPTRVPVVD